MNTAAEVANPWITRWNPVNPPTVYDVGYAHENGYITKEQAEKSIRAILGIMDEDKKEEGK